MISVTVWSCLGLLYSVIPARATESFNFSSWHFRHSMNIVSFYCVSSVTLEVTRDSFGQKIVEHFWKCVPVPVLVVIM